MQRHSFAINEATSPRLYVGGPIPEPDRFAIEKLAEEDSFRLWAELVHPDPERYAMRRMPREHWAHFHEENWMGWHDAANHPEQPDDVVPAIRRVTGWADDDTVLFMFNKWTTYKTTWGMFLRYWRKFLRMNDEPLIVRPGSDIFLCFGSAGDIGWGRRPVQVVESQLEWASTKTPTPVTVP